LTPLALKKIAEKISKNYDQIKFNNNILSRDERYEY
jgi:hypothetical protein